MLVFERRAASIWAAGDIGVLFPDCKPLAFLARCAAGEEDAMPLVFDNDTDARLPSLCAICSRLGVSWMVKVFLF